MSKGLTLLIDADVLRYQLAFSSTTNVDWDGDGETVEATRPELAKSKLEDWLHDIQERFGATDFLLPLSCPKHNFRVDIYPEYKAQRVVKPKPTLWYVLDEFLMETWGDKIVTIDNLEGDDVLGLLMTHPSPKRCPGPRIMVSIDKDMRTIPGRLYNPNRPDWGTRTSNQHDADLFWMTQVLTGDAVDNYPGFPGIGPKGADLILMPVHEEYRDATAEDHLMALWDAVVGTYTTRKPRGGTEPLTEDDALVQARLARILRHGDYSKSKGVKLWTP